MNSQTIENIMNAREDIASAEIISSNLAIKLAENGSSVSHQTVVESSSMAALLFSRACATLINELIKLELDKD